MSGEWLVAWNMHGCEAKGLNKNMIKIEDSTITHNEHKITLTWFYDEDCDPPWKNEEGHGPVSDWERRDKRPGERVLHEDHNSNLFYDFAEAVKIAKRECWDTPPYKTGTKGERAVRAAEADFQWLRRYCRNDWWYVGYQITIEGTDYEDSLWGIDSDSKDQYEKEAFERAKAWLDREVTEF